MTLPNTWMTLPIIMETLGIAPEGKGDVVIYTV